MTIQDIVDESAGYGMRFQRWMRFILNWECEFWADGRTIRTENVPGDGGGLTFAGIDKRSHPDFDYDEPRAADVARIYFGQYWEPSRAEALGFPVGEVVANFSVNMGLRASAKLLQTAVNQLPGKGATVVDGRIGPQTIEAASTEDPERLADLIEDEADERYRDIVRARPSQRKFLRGWLNRDDAVEKWWRDLSP